MPASQKERFVVPANTGLNPMHSIKDARGMPPSPAGACMTDQRVSRILTLWAHYVRTVGANLRKRVNPMLLVRTQFPFNLPTASKPPGLHIELTNLCNLKCSYCTNQLKLRSQGMMAAETFQKLNDQIRESGVERVYLVGNGEPTLHPEFPGYLRALAASTRFISLTSNWQRADQRIIDAVIQAPLDLINISLDGDDTLSYENSRIGGDFQRLLYNLQALRRARIHKNRSPLINLRVMLRPSQFDRRREIFDFWRPYGDEVSVQYVINSTGTKGDVYAVRGKYGNYPNCSFTFKQLNVNWNGDVPLCTYSGYQADDPGDAILGNINSSTITELWNHPLMRQYRRAHRERITADMPMCNGCGGC